MPSLSQKAYLEKASKTYAAQLHERRSDSGHSGAIRYLAEHAIKQDLARKYKLGYVAEPLPGDERFKGMLVVPYLTPGGCMSLKFRSLNGQRPKYAQHSGQKPRLYNAQAYFSAGNVIGVSEGEIDAIAATEHLKIPTLGCPGATNWADYWTPLFKDFTRVLVFADGDEAGKEFALSVADRIGWRARIVQCPDDEDVASLAASGRLDSISTSTRETEE